MNGKEKLMEIWSKAIALFKGDKKVKWVVFIGLAGILLILLSELIPQKSAQPLEDAVSVFADNEEFCKKTEEKIYHLVSSIEGVGNVKVWVTLESGVEYV